MMKSIKVRLMILFLGGISFFGKTQLTADFFPLLEPFCVSPTASFIPLTTFGSSCGAANSYFWDFGDGSTSTLQNPDHVYSAPGVYSVTLTVDWSCSLPYTITKTVTISDKILQSLSFSGEFSSAGVACFDGSSQLNTQLILVNGYSPVDSLRYVWGDGTSQTLTSFSQPLYLNHAYSAIGTYTIQVISFGVDPCMQDTITRVINVEQIPTASFSSSGTNCTGGNVTFTDLSSPNPIQSWNWNFGDGTPSENLQNPNHVYAYSGTMNVVLTVVSTLGCIASTNGTITITNSTTPVNFSTTNLCPCDNLNFTPTGSVTSYLWDFGDGTIATSSNPSHTFPLPGTYHVTVTGTNASGCVSKRSKDVTVCNGEQVYRTSKSNNNWQVYENSGLDFTAPTPTVNHINNKLLTATYPAREGVATVSNHITGAILFYSNGERVWDATTSVMQNGSNLKGNNSSLQGVVIVPFPSDSNKYYLFVNSGSSGGGPANQVDTLWYNVIDMTLNGGLGGVVSGQKNVFLTSTTGIESMSATIKKYEDPCEPAAYWLIVPPENNKYNVYLIDDSGVNLSSTQQFPSIISANSGEVAESSFSPSGSRYARVVSAGGVLLYDFNPVTGVLSNQYFITAPASIAGSKECMGLAFSRDNTKLYTSVNLLGSLTKYIVQYDVSTNSIKSTEYVMSAGTSLISSLRLAENDKIYFGRNFVNRLGVINSPNSSGAACSMSITGVNLGAFLSGNGLQNTVKLHTAIKNDVPIPANFIATPVCLSVSFNNTSGTVNYANPCSFLANKDTLNYSWDFGDGSSSVNQTPSHTYAAAGSYSVSLIVNRPYMCTSDTIVKLVVVDDCVSLPVDLLYFDGENTNAENVLSWSTASELNCSYFSVERSRDASAFYSIGTVSGGGTTSVQTYYSHIDEVPLYGINYYRLRQVDMDGNSHYSDVIALKAEKVGVSLYPNPATDAILLETNSTASKTVTIYMSNGKMVQEFTTTDAVTQLDVSSLSCGVYTILVKSEQDLTRLNFLKK